MRNPTCIVALVLALAWPAAGDFPREMPELPDVGADSWFNSEPLTREDLAGRVVLLHVWTFG